MFNEKIYIAACELEKAAKERQRVCRRILKEMEGSTYGRK